MLKFIGIGLLLLVILGACSPAAQEPAVADQDEGILVTVHRSPT
jgi:hypothetical protein